MYYSVFGTIVTVFVGIFASWLTKDTDENQYSLKLLHPIVRKCIQTSESYASNDMVSHNVPKNVRKSTVYAIYDLNDIPGELKVAAEAKYTRNIVI